jgi:hypothetical protein
MSFGQTGFGQSAAGVPFIQERVAQTVTGTLTLTAAAQFYTDDATGGVKVSFGERVVQTGT